MYSIEESTCDVTLLGHFGARGIVLPSLRNCLAETSLRPWLWEFDCYANNCCWDPTDLQFT